MIIFSEKDCAWIIDDTDNIKRILKSDCFKVHDFQQPKSTKYDLSTINTVINYLPLSQEGQKHNQTRKLLTNVIKNNRDIAMKSTELMLASLVKDCKSVLKSTHQPVDISRVIFQPLIDTFFKQLCGLENNLAKLTQTNSFRVDNQSDVSLSLLTDKWLPIKRRIAINHRIAHMQEELYGIHGKDYANQLIALYLLGIDSTLGTLQENFVYYHSQQSHHKISEIDFKNIVVSGVPVVERICTKSIELGNNIIINKHQRVRLLLTEDIIFGYGAHACIGASLAKELWQLFTIGIRELDVAITIQSIIYRDYDYVFNNPLNIWCELNEG